MKSLSSSDITGYMEIRCCIEIIFVAVIIVWRKKGCLWRIGMMGRRSWMGGSLFLFRGQEIKHRKHKDQKETTDFSAVFLRILRKSAGNTKRDLFPADLRRIRRKTAE